MKGKLSVCIFGQLLRSLEFGGFSIIMSQLHLTLNELWKSVKDHLQTLDRRCRKGESLEGKYFFLNQSSDERDQWVFIVLKFLLLGIIYLSIVYNHNI